MVGKECKYIFLESDTDDEGKGMIDQSDEEGLARWVNHWGNLPISNLWIYSGNQQPNKYYKYTRTKRSSENKKLVFLSKKVLELVSTNVDTTGTIVSYSVS